MSAGRTAADEGGGSAARPEGLVVLYPKGDLDVLTSPGLRRHLLELLDAGVPFVVIDMSGVGFLDSAGLSALVGVHRSLPSGQQIALANVPRRMQRALHISAVETLFLVHVEGETWRGPGVLPVGHPSR